MPLPFVLAAPSHVLPIVAPFSAVAIDAPRRRMFAAGAKSVAVLDAVTGRVTAVIRIGGVRSLAVEPLGGHLFAGTADGRISELDPDRRTIVRSMDAAGETDVLIYDAFSGRLYADGAGSNQLGVFDAVAFRRVATSALTGTASAQLAADPITRELYVAVADRAEIAVFDLAANAVHRTFATPGLLGRRIVRFDDALGQIVAIGTNGLLDVYDRAGTRRERISVPPGISACDLDTSDHVLACTGPPGLTFIQLVREAPPQLLGTVELPAPAFAAVDTQTHDVVAVRSNPDGTGADFERFSTAAPNPGSSASPH